MTTKPFLWLLHFGAQRPQVQIRHNETSRRANQVHGLHHAEVALGIGVLRYNPISPPSKET